MMFVFPVLIVALIYYLYRDRAGYVKTGKTAKEALRERFVKGEIDEATYIHMKEILEK